MKIGFLFKKQQEIEAEKQTREEVKKNRLNLKEEKEEIVIEEPPKKKQPKKIKANLEALKK